MNWIWMGLFVAAFWAAAFFVFRLLSRSYPALRIILLPLFWLALAGGLELFIPFSPPGWRFLREASFPGFFLAAGAVLLLINLALAGLGSALRREEREFVLPPLLRKLILLVVYFVAAVILLKNYYPALNLTGLLIGSTVFSAVVGLALQDTLVNFISGVTLSADKPFRVGDWIRVGEKEGVVNAISWRATRILTRANNLLVIPNSVIARETVVNFNYPSPVLRESVEVGISYRIPPRRVREALLEAAGRVPEVQGQPPPAVHLISFDDFSIRYRLLFWLADYENAPALAGQVRMEIYDTLRSRGIPIPFPIRDVYVRRAREETGKAGPRLRVLEGPRAGETIPVPGEGLSIGREKDNTLVLSHPAVSKHHARIVLSPEGPRLEDLESKGGTRVNGREARSQPLRDGDEIALGLSRFLFEE